MRWVQQPAIRPHRCAVIPFIGGHNSKAGFFDTGQDMRADDHVYVSIEAVEQMATALGWAPPDVALVEKAKKLEDRIAVLEAEVAEADRYSDAVEYTLGKFGTQVRNKPGRKAKVEA